MSTTTVAPEHQPALHRPANTGRRPGFRPDIQALRAIAVLAVVLNHLWPTRLTGGFVGVDVFFVISGFLISSHLGREIRSTGRVRLVRFYARRARRLLPAAFTVLLLSLIAAVLLLPYSLWGSNASEALAAVVYGENWLLAAKAVDYSAMSDTATMAQHYWSLSVEEQFYLCWPLLLIALAWLRRRTRIPGIGWAGVALIGGASLWFSVYYTEAEKSAAYFVTPTRVWEFAIGAGIALAAHRIVLPALVANLTSLLGFALILIAAVAFDHTTAFPGYAALLPTLGTGLVIASGIEPRELWHEKLSARRPVQWVGDISYSLYLWHWPLIVLGPFALSARLTWYARLALLALALVLAWLSKRYLEDRAMSWPKLTVSSRRTLVAMVAGMLVTGLTGSGLAWGAEMRTEQAQVEQREAAAKPCFGAAALKQGSRCADRFRPANDVNMTEASRYWLIQSGCRPDESNLPRGTTLTPVTCDYSQGKPGATRVWLIGDSHALQWQAALADLARERHWILRIDFQPSCPLAHVRFRGKTDVQGMAESEKQHCMRFGEDATEQIAQEKPAYVFTASFTRFEKADDGSGRSELEQYREGLHHYWGRWTAAGAKVFAMADPPLGTLRPKNCVILNPDDPLACAMDRTRATTPDAVATAARESRDPNVRLVDLTNYFCDHDRCYSVVGGVPVYLDDNHLNAVYTRTLRPMIAAAAGV
ncbi:acyltransferase [Pseudonocardiaceae bacterium YIM PH 21723]|nr:acyltransferase [Pseudonocardiaceae bacterium YIM PH 21723]